MNLRKNCGEEWKLKTQSTVEGESERIYYTQEIKFKEWGLSGRHGEAGNKKEIDDSVQWKVILKRCASADHEGLKYQGELRFLKPLQRYVDLHLNTSL